MAALEVNLGVPRVWKIHGLLVGWLARSRFVYERSSLSLYSVLNQYQSFFSNPAHGRADFASYLCQVLGFVEASAAAMPVSGAGCP